jgi:hypothetical protein
MCLVYQYPSIQLSELCAFLAADGVVPAARVLVKDALVPCSLLELWCMDYMDYIAFYINTEGPSHPGLWQHAELLPLSGATPADIRSALLWCPHAHQSMQMHVEARWVAIQSGLQQLAT